MLVMLDVIYFQSYMVILFCCEVGLGAYSYYFFTIHGVSMILLLIRTGKAQKKTCNAFLELLAVKTVFGDQAAKLDCQNNKSYGLGCNQRQLSRN